MRLSPHARTAAPRETHARPHNSHAFTLVELMAFTVIVTALVLMIIPRIGHHGGKHPRIKCVNNLKNVGLAYRIYATDNNDRFPWEALPPNRSSHSPDPVTYILQVTNELSTPLIVKCPEDSGKTESKNWTQFSRTNLSYFISLDASEALPQSFLAGDRNITNQFGTLRPGLRGLSRTNNTAGWDQTIHKSQGNTCMGDGSVQQLSVARLREQLRNTGQSGKYIKLSVP